MPQEKINVGIAGLGRSGWNIHAKLLAELPDQYQVVAVLDADADRRQEAIDRFDCLAYTEKELDQLIHDKAVELVVVALPSFLHASASVEALEAGKHVVCEKPMATSLPDADKMVEVSQKSDKVLTIFHQRRYQPDFQKVMEVVSSGILGRIVQIRLCANGFSRRWDWQTLQKYGGGSLNNTGPHFLDMALQIYGEGYPEVVYSHLDRTLTLGDADDHVKLVFKGEGKPTVDIEISSACAYAPPMWTIMGTEGGLTGSPRKLEWKWANWTQMEPRELSEEPTPNRSYNRDEIVWKEDSWEAAGSPGEAFLGFYTDLFDTIRGDSPLTVTPEQIRRVMWLQEEAHRLSPLG